MFGRICEYLMPENVSLKKGVRSLICLKKIEGGGNVLKNGESLKSFYVPK